MKGNPADLRELAHDLNRAMVEHPDALRANPDLHVDLRILAKKAAERYAEVTESRDDV